MKIIAQIDFSVKDNYYKKGNEIKNIFDINTLVSLNERGFIEKISQEQLLEYEKNIKNNINKEKDTNG